MTGNGGNRLDRIERLLEQTVRASKEAERTSKQAHARLDADLRKWVKSGVKEALSHRKRMREIDDKITQLAAAQLVTEEKLQRFISSAGRGRNGHTE